MLVLYLGFTANARIIYVDNGLKNLFNRFAASQLVRAVTLRFGKYTMQIRELLVEYNREITARQVGDRLIDAVKNDRSNVPNEIWPYVTKIEPLTDQERRELINEILAVIESKDPTANKIYTPWLARMYAKGGLRLEDMNRNDFLSIYDEGKRRRRIRPEHADINRFKSYRDFEDVMWQEYDQAELVDKSEKTSQGQAAKFYEDDTVTVIVPKDKNAACRYGRGTRWCTAATRGENYFDFYNRSGPLYILIPKKPLHQGEKYQLQFQRTEFMDETDTPVDLVDLITVRFPQLKEVFIKTWPAIIGDLIDFVPKELVKDAVKKVHQFLSTDRKINFYLSEIAHNDEGFLSWGRNSGKYDHDKSWVENYLRYKPGVRNNLTQQLAKLLIPVNLLLKEAKEMEISYPKIRDVPELIYEYMNQKDLYSNYPLYGQVIAQTLRDVSVKLVGDTVYVDQRDWAEPD